MILNQLGRRNIPNFVRAELALKLKPVIAAKAKENQVSSGESFGKGLQNSVKAIESIDTQKQLAKQAGVSHDTIAKVEKILHHSSDDIKKKLRSVIAAKAEDNQGARNVIMGNVTKKK